MKHHTFIYELMIAAVKINLTIYKARSLNASYGEFCLPAKR